MEQLLTSQRTSWRTFCDISDVIAYFVNLMNKQYSLREDK